MKIKFVPTSPLNIYARYVLTLILSNLNSLVEKGDEDIFSLATKILNLLFPANSVSFYAGAILMFFRLISKLFTFYGSSSGVCLVLLN